MTEQDKTQTSIKSLDAQLRSLRGDQADHSRYAAFAAVASALAVGMVVLSTSTWFTQDGFASTPWEQPPAIHSFGYVVAVLIMVLPLVSLLAITILKAGPSLHWLVAILAAVTAVCLLVMSGQTEQGSTHTAPGYWFTIIAAFALAVAHGTRASQIMGERERLY